MPGLRKLRDVGSKISGALAPPRAEGRPDDAAERESTAMPQEAAPEAVTDATPPAAEQVEPSAAPEPADAAAADDVAEAAEAVLATEAAQAPEAPEPPTGADTPAGATELGDVAPGGMGPTEQAVTADEPDAACAAAVDLARAAAVEDAGDAVGDHEGVQAEPAREGEHVVTHLFGARIPGYTGWRWAVTVARAEGTDAVTVDEVVLLPGPDALLAPAWVPWTDRVRPGDLGPGDLLPPPDEDPRLVPSYEDVDSEQLPFDLHRDLGLGRPRVLSAEGRTLAADRWYEGEGGPRSPLARQAPGRCADCGFLAPLAGELGLGFGVCANAVAPDDGRVVALLHGCGAHSETVTKAAHASTTELVVEHEELELVDVAASAAEEPAED